MKITGVMIQYYFKCKRELWLFSKQLNFDFENDDMKIGKILHNIYYKQENTKNLILNDTISIDLVKKDHEIYLIYEIKKSSKTIELDKYQLYYYLYYLEKNYGVNNLKGFLVVPKEKKRIEITLTDEIRKKLENALEEIPSIVNSDKIPKKEFKKYCKKCSYYEFCWC